MAALPDFDALGLGGGMMFEEAKPFQAHTDAPANALTPQERARLRAMVGPGGDDRFADRPARRAGDALRAVEWSEITARLNAARDLRLLLRTESQAPIESVAASFGDAAASYFAMIDDGEPGFNHDALGQSKALDAINGSNDANRPDEATGAQSDKPAAMRETGND
jgi:hypothetical protein